MLTIRRKLFAAAYYPFRLVNAIGRRVGLLLPHSLRVLICHDIAPSDQACFASQIRWLARSWNFVAPEQFVSMMSGKAPITGHNLLLTFDDGFHSNRIVAERILAPLGIKAVFFIPTGFIQCEGRDAQQEYIRQRLKCQDIAGRADPMRWDDLRWLAEHGHEIGAHTLSHAKLSHVTDSTQLEGEIVASGDEIEKKLGIHIRFFAYPFGDIDSINCRALTVIGRRYQLCFSGIRGNNNADTHRLAIRREAINVRDGRLYNGFVLSGGLSFYYRARRRSLDMMAEWL